MSVPKKSPLSGRPLLSAVLTLLFVAGGARPARAAGAAEHVVLIVWDGLRPEMVTAANTPALYKLAQTGTIFSRHHAVYPSTTEVNGTALATGMYPANSGIIGNREYRPKINPAESFATESPGAIRKGDALTTGKYLAVPTIYETLQQTGESTVVAGTKAVALIPDRSAQRPNGAAAQSVNVFSGKTLPEGLLSRLEETFGKFPEKPTFPDGPQNKWTVDVLLDSLWKTGVPKLSLLWLSDPDYTQHDTQPGSEKALASLKINDALLARLLEALDKKSLLDKTDILLVSDHGFSTIDQAVDFAALLSEAGFRAFRKFLQEPVSGDILVVGNGGTVFFYVVGHDRETTRRLVEFLQQGPLCGVLFSSEKLPGTFSPALAHVNSPDVPDVIVSLRWNRSQNASGVAGMIVSDSPSNKQPGHGMHGSLSPFDMHNTLIARGPDFRQGFVDPLPSGNVDVGPTVLWILGVAPARKMDGRVLGESLRKSPFPPPHVQSISTSAASTGSWRQYLKLVTVDGTEYLEEGNAGDPGKSDRKPNP